MSYVRFVFQSMGEELIAAERSHCAVSVVAVVPTITAGAVAAVAAGARATGGKAKVATTRQKDQRKK